MKLQPFVIPLTGLQNHSKNPEKGLVWDQEAGVYRVISGDVLNMAIIVRKPISQGIKWFAGLGGAGLAIAALLVFVISRNATPASTADPSTNASKSVVNAVDTTLEKRLVAEPVTSAPAVIQLASKVTDAAREPTLPPVVTKPNQVAKAATPAARSAPVPQLPGDGASAGQANPMAAVRPSPEILTPASLQRGWPISVEANGVRYFDGKETKLYKRDEILPNGEKIVEVDEGSATFATDKGVRQIRSSKLKGN